MNFFSISFWTLIYKSSLFQSAGVYTFANIISTSIPFLLLPILTRYLTPVDYGMVAMLQVLVSLIRPFVGFSVNGAIAIKFFKKVDINFPKYVSSCFVIVISATILMSVLLTIFRIPVSQISQFPVDWLWIVSLMCLGEFACSVLLVILQSSDQPKIYGLIQISQVVINIIFTLILVVIFELKWQGRVIAQGISLGLVALFSIKMLYSQKWIVLKYDEYYIKDALKFCIPLIPHTLAAVVMVMVSRIIIADSLGLGDAGIYVVAAQLAGVIDLLVGSFNQAYATWLYSKLAKPNYEMKIKIVKFTYAYMVGILLCTIAFANLMPLLLQYIIGKDFFNVGRIMGWIALGSAFSGMYLMVAHYIFFVEKTAFLVRVTVLTSILQIVLTYFGVQYLGIIGAAYATAFSYFIKFVFTWMLSCKVYSMPWFSLYKLRNKEDNV